MCFAVLRIESSPVSQLIIKRSYTVFLTQVASASDAVAAPADFGSVILPFLLYISLLSVLHACLSSFILIILFQDFILLWLTLWRRCICPILLCCAQFILIINFVAYDLLPFSKKSHPIFLPPACTLYRYPVYGTERPSWVAAAEVVHKALTKHPFVEIHRSAIPCHAIPCCAMSC